MKKYLAVLALAALTSSCANTGTGNRAEYMPVAKAEEMFASKPEFTISDTIQNYYFKTSPKGPKEVFVYRIRTYHQGTESENVGMDIYEFNGEHPLARILKTGSSSTVLFGTNECECRRAVHYDSRINVLEKTLAEIVTEKRQ